MQLFRYVKLKIIQSELPGLFTSQDCCSDKAVAHELYLYTTIGLQRSRCCEIGLIIRMPRLFTIQDCCGDKAVAYEL